MGLRKTSWAGWSLAVTAVGVLPAHAQNAEGAVTFKCPGNVYTNMITPQEAKARNCTTIEGAPITIVQTPRRRTEPSRPAEGASGAAVRPAEARVDPAAQRQRDADARRILQDELRREEERLAAMQREYNNGQPERRGDEQNYAKYLDRVAEMKAAIERKQADIAAIKREIDKLPPAL